MSTSDDRRARITAAWTAAWDNGDVDAFDHLLSPDYRRRTKPSDTGLDRTEFKASVISTRTAFPDLATTVDDIVVEGDLAAIRWHSRGRQNASFLGVPATHREVEVSGATFARFADDHIVEEFVTWDPRTLLTALGVISVGQDH